MTRTKHNNKSGIRSGRTWIRSYDPTLYDFIRALKEQGFVYWNQHKNRYSIGDILYLYAIRPVKRIVCKVEVAEKDVVYEDGMDRDDDFYLKPYPTDREMNPKCIKVIPLDYNISSSPSYNDLQEIGVLNLKSANTLSAAQVSAIEEMFVPEGKILVQIAEGAVVMNKNGDKGIVTSFDGKRLTVAFENRSADFFYPSAFEKGFLVKV